MPSRSSAVSGVRWALVRAMPFHISARRWWTYNFGWLSARSRDGHRLPELWCRRSNVPSSAGTPCIDVRVRPLNDRRRAVGRRATVGSADSEAHRRAASDPRRAGYRIAVTGHVATSTARRWRGGHRVGAHVVGGKRRCEVIQLVTYRLPIRIQYHCFITPHCGKDTVASVRNACPSPHVKGKRHCLTGAKPTNFKIRLVVDEFVGQAQFRCIFRKHDCHYIAQRLAVQIECGDDTLDTTVAV